LDHQRYGYNKLIEASMKDYILKENEDYDYSIEICNPHIVEHDGNYLNIGYYVIYEGNKKTTKVVMWRSILMDKNNVS
jgi:hypothetical protein